ncbi:hypothetical protein [Yinghuangia sp. YIM S09857]|uniref:hypothetical protein n=1 Tax=Yinghuangia sp. YIM S09857 TaxID=3436929 RepID=UPI003F53511B
MPNHKRPRLLARAASRVIARHHAEPPVPAVPVEQPAESRTQVAAALAALAVLDADPAASAVCAWRISEYDAQMHGGLVTGQLSVNGPDRDAASLALLAALVDKYGGTVHEGSPLGSGRVEVSARFQLCGVGVVIWDLLKPLVCSRCGAPGTWTVTFTSRVCPDCVEEIDREDAAATKATLGTQGGVTSPDALGLVTLPDDDVRRAYVAIWLPKLRELVLAAGGVWVPERVSCVLMAQYPSAVMTITHERAVDLLSALASEGTLVLDDREGAGFPRWTAALPVLPPAPPVREFDADGADPDFDFECSAVLIGGELTHCGCPGCQDRTDLNRSAPEVAE